MVREQSNTINDRAELHGVYAVEVRDHLLKCIKLYIFIQLIFPQELDVEIDSFFLLEHFLVEGTHFEELLRRAAVQSVRKLTNGSLCNDKSGIISISQSKGTVYVKET